MIYTNWLGNFVSNNFKKKFIQKNLLSENIVTVPIETRKIGMGGGIVKLGRPFLGRYVKMGQSRTWDGWGVQRSLKKWDILYGRSLTYIFFTEEVAILKNTEVHKGVCLSDLEYHGLITTFIVSF